MGMKWKIGARRTLEVELEYLGEMVMTKFSHLCNQHLPKMARLHGGSTYARCDRADFADHDPGFARSQRQQACLHGQLQAAYAH